MLKNFFRVRHTIPSIVGIVACALFGCALLIEPEISTEILVYAVAVILLIVGIACVWRYFAAHAAPDETSLSLAGGLVLVTVGVALLAFPYVPAYILPFAWGGVLVAGGFGKVQYAFDLKTLGLERWWLVLIGAGVSLVLGTIALCNPFGVVMTLLRFIGASLLAEAALDAVSAILYTRRVLKWRNEHKGMNEF